MQPKGIDILVPGLMGPMPVLGDIDVKPNPGIERALSRANLSVITPKDYTSTLFFLFGLNQDQSDDLPTAPYCRLADSAEHDDAYWLQVSPVHLRPDGDKLLLFDVAHLKLSMDEAQQLADMVREHFSDHGWRLELYDPQRWYLRLQDRLNIRTSPLSDVIGRNIDSFLPRGEDAMDWHFILNELQMLLHMSKVNLLREGRGLLPVNGLWLHGGGSYQAIEQASYAVVSGDDPLLRGMALAAGVEPSPLCQDSAELISDKARHLVVYDRLQRSVLDADPYGWIDALEIFDKWLEPLLGAVLSNRLGYIDIYPCNGNIYRLGARSLRRFWRRRKPLSYYISS